MLKLFPVYFDSQFVIDILNMIDFYGGLIFSKNQIPRNVFLSQLKQNKIRVIGAIFDGKFIGFLVLYDFYKLNDKYFYCYIYGALKRNYSIVLDKAFDIIFSDLKNKGCIALRCETKKYNMPMRLCANRLGFKKIGIFHNSYYENEKFVDSIVYEKLLQ